MSVTWVQREGAVVDGQFHLGGYIGGSGRSAVFRTQAGDHEAAIKLIPADSRDAEQQLARWKHAVHLNHPHLMRIFRTGRCQLGGTAMLYAVMELASENLGEILPSRALTPEEAREMLEPVLDALSYLHRQGFAHARLKPANIMVVDERLKVSSDGLLRLGEFASRHEKTGAYDPPEMRIRENTPAGDVWSLGITLVETLTRQFPTRDPKTQEDPTLPGSLPQPFREIALRSLRCDPEARCSVAGIRALLQAPPDSIRVEPEPVREAKKEVSRAAPIAAKPKAPTNEKSYVVSAIVAAMIIAAIYIGPRLINRREAPTPAASAADAVTPSASPVSSGSKEEATAAREHATHEAPPVAPKRAEKALSAPSPVEKRATVPHSEMKPNPPAPASSDFRIVKQVMPDVSQRALNTIRGKVRVVVKLAVDPTGSVTRAEVNSSGGSQYFSDRTLQAARQWRFAPATAAQAQAVASEWLVQFDFHPDTTTVSSQRVAP